MSLLDGLQDTLPSIASEGKKNFLRRCTL